MLIAGFWGKSSRRRVGVGMGCGQIGKGREWREGRRAGTGMFVAPGRAHMRNCAATRTSSSTCACPAPRTSAYSSAVISTSAGSPPPLLVACPGGEASQAAGPRSKPPPAHSRCESLSDCRSGAAPQATQAGDRRARKVWKLQVRASYLVRGGGQRQQGLW